jgi:hypothetical protein
MALIKPANTTVSVYRGVPVFTNPPAVDNVPCWFQGNYWAGLKHGDDSDPVAFKYTHVILVDLSVDVRDAYVFGIVTGTPDTVIIPGNNPGPSSTKYVVKFVERINRGLSGDCKRVYLERVNVNWPQNLV